MTKSFNLANLSKEDLDKTNIDLAASGVAYKERMNQPVIADQVEREQPEHFANTSASALLTIER